MSWLRKISFRLQPLFKKRKIEEGLSEEIRTHLEMQTEANVAAGMPADEARFAARRQFGGVDQIKEQYRDERGLRWLEDLAQDCRFALRQLAKAPGFTAIAVLTVAVGIGACTAIFSVANGVLFSPLNFPDPDRLVNVAQTLLPRFPVVGVTPGVYLDWIGEATSFQNLAAISGRSYNTTSLGDARHLRANLITANFAPTLGLKPVVGRNFLSAEQVEGRDRVVLLAYRFWKQDFGGRADAVGKTLRLDDQIFTIVGVLPDMPDMFFNTDIFTPLTFSAADRANFGNFSLWAIARLKPGASLAQAQGEMTVIAGRVAREHPATYQGIGALVQPLKSAIAGNNVTVLVLLGAVGLLLAIACVNVANLLLARASARQKEFAVRAALGAGRGRIIRQFLCESMMIAVAGGILGTLFAFASMGGLVEFAGHFISRKNNIAIDPVVLETMCGLMLVTGFGFGLIPALQATRAGAIGALKDSARGSTGGARRHRTRTFLVVAEISLALTLLGGAGVLGRSIVGMERLDEGFTIDNIWTNGFSLTSGKVYATPQRITAFIDAAMQRISTLPEVRSCGITSGVPMGTVDSELFATPETAQKPLTDWPLTDVVTATPQYFGTIGIPLLSGRLFNSQDTPASPRVALVNRELARKYFPDRDPIGQRITLGTGTNTNTWYKIIGVVGNVRSHGPQNPISPQIYEAMSQDPTPRMVIAIKSRGAVPNLAAEVRDIVHSLDPDVPFDTLYPLYNTVSFAWREQQFALVLFCLFSGIALLLAAIGIYGVMAFSVSQRTGEIGIRMALGAQRGNIFGLVLGDGAKIAGIGLVVGLAGALGFTHLIRSFLFNTSPNDPLALTAVAVLLAAVALLACWIPARRATRVDPIVALRSE